MRSLTILAVLTATASAEPSLVAQASSESAPRFALAVNNPLGWIPSLGASDQPSFGISAYVGVTDHVVLRGNVAYHPVDGRLAGFPYSECGTAGTSTDISASAQYYLASRLHGFFIEGGGLRRSNPSSDYQCDPVDEVDEVKTSSTSYGGLALLGWSYSRSHFFLSIAAGGSALHESGEQKTISAIDYMTTTTEHISRTYGAFEWNLRLGASF